MEEAKALRELRANLIPWWKKNFPNAGIFEPATGLVEELGELAHAILKDKQNIRQDEDHQRMALDAIGDCVVYLIHCTELTKGFDFDTFMDVYTAARRGKSKGAHISSLRPFQRDWLEKKTNSYGPGVPHVRMGLTLLASTSAGRISENIILFRTGALNTRFMYLEMTNVLMVLGMIADTYGKSLDDCLQVAWDEIKDRNWSKPNELPGIDA